MRQIITLRAIADRHEGVRVDSFHPLLQVPEAKAGIYKSNFAVITNRILTSDFYILP